MKQIINAFVYMIVSCIIIILTLILISNIKPVNHTHDKQLQDFLINKKWINNESILVFNEDHTIYYVDKKNKHPMDQYYNVCNIWKWSKERRQLDIECSNPNYEQSNIEIVSITKDTLNIKTYNKYLSFKRN